MKQRSDSLRNRAAVLSAAAAAFAEAGTDVPMERIAERAGLGVGTLYRHFPSKDALIESVVADQLVRLATMTANVLGLPEHGGIPGLIRCLADELALKHMLVAYLSRDGQAFETHDLPEMRQFLAALDLAAQRARDRGALHRDITSDDILAVTVAVAHSPKGDRLIELAIRGLQPPAERIERRDAPAASETDTPPSAKHGITA